MCNLMYCWLHYCFCCTCNLSQYLFISHSFCKYLQDTSSFMILSPITHWHCCHPSHQVFDLSTTWFFLIALRAECMNTLSLFRKITRRCWQGYGAFGTVLSSLFRFIWCLDCNNLFLSFLASKEKPAFIFHNALTRKWLGWRGRWRGHGGR